MIGYLEGKLLRKEEDKILLLVNQIGYEVMLPSIVMDTMKAKNIGEDVSLFIYWQQTERQPRPVLIGFNTDLEREFFQYFISVEDIGPLKALKALNMPVDRIASAIETADLSLLIQLKGVGNRTAQKIIATLQGKVGKFVSINEKPSILEPQEFMVEKVIEVLTNQLGYKMVDARQLIKQALKDNLEAKSPEVLLEKVLRGRSA
jgi:Holliday junction DNA helicase RuvA